MPAEPDVHVIDLDRPVAIAVHAARTVLLTSVLPMAAFYLTLSLAGLRAAVVVTAGWYYAGLLVRWSRRRPILGAAALGAGLMTIRAVVTFWTGSTFVYFLQPVAGTVVTATSIAVTGLAGRPLLERLAHDFVKLPPALSQRMHASGFFRHSSWLWAVVYFVNAAGTVWLLTTSSVGGFILMKTLLSPALTGAAIVATYLLFRALMRREGVRIRWQPSAV